MIYMKGPLGAHPKGPGEEFHMESNAFPHQATSKTSLGWVSVHPHSPSGHL